MKKVITYTATIYCGLRDGYGEEINSSYPDVINDYINNRSGGLCVTCTSTTFYYNGGQEPGIIVGIINYPRYPFSDEKIRRLAFELAEKLMIKCKQYRVSIVFPEETILLENKEKIEQDGTIEKWKEWNKLSKSIKNRT